MELENFKSLYLERPVSETSIEQPDKVLSFRKKNSNAIISKLKRNLLLECYIAVLFIIFPIYIFMDNSGYLKYFSVFTAFIIVEFCISGFRLLKAINRFQRSTRAVKQHLHLLINILKRFSRLYLRSTMVVVPSLFLTALLFIYADNFQKDPLLYVNYYRNTMLMYLFALCAWWPLMYIFTKWYIGKLYGKHLQYLQQQLVELERA